MCNTRIAFWDLVRQSCRESHLINSRLFISVPEREQFVRSLLFQRIFSTDVLRYREYVKYTEWKGPMRRLFREIQRKLLREYLTESSIPLKTRLLFVASWNSSFMYKLYLRTRENVRRNK